MLPSEIVKQAWPRNRTWVIESVLLCRGMAGRGAELTCQLESDRDADQHAQPGFLGQQTCGSRAMRS